ncbi:MAG: serine hydrolase domain-containing protein, partial [Candidatus Acidiferrum sp.]
HYNPDCKGDIPEDSAKHFATMEEALQVFAGDPLLSKPGTRFHYSTYGYTVLGCVLEGAASQKYVDYVRENIFRPAAMEQTRDDNYFAVIPHRTRFYHQDQTGVVRNAGVLDSSYKIPGGGLISSADDLALFEAAILNDKLMKRATRDIMWTPQKPADGSRDPYALGWGTFPCRASSSWDTPGASRAPARVLPWHRSGAPEWWCWRTWTGWTRAAWRMSL